MGAGKQRHITEPLALNWEEAKKPGNKNATKYVRAFLRMIVIGEAGGRSAASSAGDISPYNLCVGGHFVSQRAQGAHPSTKDPKKAHRLGPKSSVGNSFVGYDGHPKLRFKYTERFTGRTENGKSIEWRNNSSAAGRYQFLEGTWGCKPGKPSGREGCYQWGKHYTDDETDFSPINQDRCVINLLASKGIKDILEKGGDNFVTPDYGGSKIINKGRDTRPATVAEIPEVSAHPTNMFEQQFFMAVKEIKHLWASLPGAGYEGQETSRKASEFLGYYKYNLAQEINDENAG
jgi:muramidase (phage lysozyme)